MNAPHHHSSRCAALLLAGLSGAFSAQAGAQQQATTLLALGERAEIVVLATAVERTDPSADLHRVGFRTDRVLRGAAPQQFSLIEPAGRCCGRSLFALQLGEQRLLFLQRRGATLHALGGDRGVVAASEALVEHAAALLAATDTAARQPLLVAALQSDEPRVAIDAALALPTLPDLRRDSNTTEQLLTVLRRELQHNSALLPSLLDAVVRADDGPAATRLLPLYVAADRHDQATTLQRALSRLPAQQVRDAILVAGAQTDRSPRTTQRIADYFAARPEAANVAILDRMLDRGQHPRAALAVTEALLAHGVDPAQLAHRVPMPVLLLAQQRRAERTSPRTGDKRTR